MKYLKKVFIAFLVLASRLKIMPVNFSMLGSYGFFGQNVWLYMAVIVGFDVFFGGFYKGFIFTYIGFLGYYFLGKLAKDNLKRQLLFLPLASFFFFLISNFGVWLSWYPQTWSGLLDCYVMALPFYRNTLIGDLVFGYGFMVLNFFLKKQISIFNFSQLRN